MGLLWTPLGSCRLQRSLSKPHDQARLQGDSMTAWVMHRLATYVKAEHYFLPGTIIKCLFLRHKEFYPLPLAMGAKHSVSVNTSAIAAAHRHCSPAKTLLIPWHQERGPDGHCAEEAVALAQGEHPLPRAEAQAHLLLTRAELFLFFLKSNFLL